MLGGYPFAREFAYDQWANGSLIETLESRATPPDDAVRLLSHLLAAQKIWLARLRGEDPTSFAPRPVRSLAACGKESEAVRESLDAYLRELGEDDLDAVVEYQNTRGIPFRTSIRDILTHLFFHGAHHRAQIAALLREARTEPPAIDFIFFVRLMDEDGAA